MGRSVDEVVHVKVSAGSGAGAGSGVPAAPEAFVWRGRLYVVREVLAGWSARLPWWEGSAARALRGGPAPAVRGSSALAPVPEARTGPAGDEQVWRVVASAGFAAEPGTFELAAAPGAEQWRLVRVVD